jgi:RNA polymerase sigma-70 factor (ECF subfamily)
MASADSVWSRVDRQSPAASVAADVEIATLTRRLERGDEAAWRAFFDRYFERLLRYSLVLHRGEEDLAREALQLAMIRAARHMRRFENEAALWCWLIVLLKSCIVDEARKRRRYGNALDRFRSEPGSAPSSDGPAAAVDHCLPLLEPNDRALLEQKYLQGDSVRDIAAAAGSSEKSIESRLTRCRRRLKKLLLRYWHDESDQ